MNNNKTDLQIYTSPKPERKREKQSPQKLQPKDYYVKIYEPIQHARALTDKTKMLYCAVKHWLKNKPNCTPSYEMLGEWAGIRSKATISKHLKVLKKVGLIRVKRRGFKVSNQYEVPELTDEIFKKLYIPHKCILAWIIEEDEQKKQRRLVKRELRERETKRMYIKSGFYKKAPIQSYPQIDEVHFLNSNVFSSLREENTKSSNRYDQKIKIEEKRNGLTKIGTILPTKAQGKALLNYLQARISPVDVANSWAASRPPGSEYKPFGNEKLIGVTTEIALKLGDLKNLRSDIGHTHNIFKLIKPVGRTEADLISMLYTALSLTQKHEGSFTTSPMAYMYSIVEYAYNLKVRKSPP